MKLKPRILVHGGAGSWEGRLPRGLAGCRTAATVACPVLTTGDALAAVIAAVRILENNPEFNAGTGAVLTRDGSVEVDAAVMRGRDLAVGAIAAVPMAANGIELAHAVLRDGEHALISGPSAWTFLRAHGYSPAKACALITKRSKQRLDAEATRRQQDQRGTPDPGTVGAVAVDANGNVAAATSTGGTTYKRCGRIGDTPLFGCGTWADNESAAASATGHGESIIRIAMTRLACEAVATGASAQAGADAAVKALDRVAGKAGIIVVDPQGIIGVAHNTQAMPVAWMSPGDAHAEACADANSSAYLKML